MTQQQLSKLLDKLIAEKGSQQDTAAFLGISASYLSDVLAGKRNAGPKLLEKLGLEAQLIYVQKGE